MLQKWKQEGNKSEFEGFTDDYKTSRLQVFICNLLHTESNLYPTTSGRCKQVGLIFQSQYDTAEIREERYVNIHFETTELVSSTWSEPASSLSVRLCVPGL